MKVSEVGEFGLIALLTREFGIEYPPKRGHTLQGLLVPLGDDAVVTQPRNDALIWTTDTMVDGNHFRAGFSPWPDVGWKSLASNVSDIAAMGGEPHLALVTLMLPPDHEVEDVLALYRGLHECATAFGVTLGGGDIVNAPVFAITVALSGWAFAGDDGVPAVLRREEARPGDLVAVTGTPGDSAGGLKLLLGGLDVSPEACRRLIERHSRPVPRVEAGRAAVLAGLRCGIDVSDGVLQDLGHIATASGVAIEVDASRMPLSDALREVWSEQALELALGGGEDYELIVIGSPEAMEPYVARSQNGATIIGKVVSEGQAGVRVVDAAGRELTPAHRGWDHFAAR